ncbi:hypothetical protein NW762_003798 [Fusarium torreyae]|uniref:Uncharacterized protein n=1 Tax=Fusarium torreyae TaxID=1237075 RepID=A0A9W8S975_9HYPO|nr:hypothetical protein NW762_003798 [Fusarium torreyae]
MMEIRPKSRKPSMIQITAAMIRLLKSFVLEHVRSISIFEDFNEEIMAALRADKPSYWDDEFYDINTIRIT